MYILYISFFIVRLGYCSVETECLVLALGFALYVNNCSVSYCATVRLSVGVTRILLCDCDAGAAGC